MSEDNNNNESPDMNEGEIPESPGAPNDGYGDEVNESQIPEGGKRLSL